MGKYVRLEKGTNEEMYPKTTADQVIYEGGAIKGTQAKWNKQIDNDLNQLAGMTFDKRHISEGGLSIIIHKGEYGDIWIDIPIQEGQIPEGLLSNFDYDDFVLMRDTDIPNLLTRVENNENSIKELQKGLSEWIANISTQFSKLEQRVAALEAKNI